MTLKDLTPAARAAVKQKTIGGGWSRRSLVKLMAELDRWDNMAEGRKAWAKKVFIGGIIGSVLGFILMFFVSAITDEFLFGLPMFLVPLAVLIIGIRMKKAARAVDLPNELGVSLRPVLRQLTQDLHPNEKIKVSMNLAGIAEGKCANKKNLPPGRNRSLTQSTYDEDLCNLRLPLTDGSTAVLRMENQYLKLERSYRSSRGKSKSKTKWKKLSTVTAILIPPTPIRWNPSGAAQSMNAANERMSFPEKNGVTVARMDSFYKFKAAGNPPDNAVPGEDIVRMFVRLTAMRPRAAGGSL